MMGTGSPICLRDREKKKSVKGYGGALKVSCAAGGREQYREEEVQHGPVIACGETVRPGGGGEVLSCKDPEGSVRPGKEGGKVCSGLDRTLRAKGERSKGRFLRRP